MTEQQPLQVLRELAELADSPAAQVQACRQIRRVSSARSDHDLVLGVLRFIQATDRGGPAVAAAALELEMRGLLSPEAEMFLIELPCNSRGPCGRVSCACGDRYGVQL